MQLALVHYHLNRGGVTQVILNHLHALGTLPQQERPERVLVLHGGRAEGWPEEALTPFEVQTTAVDGLDYDAFSAADANKLAKSLSQTLHAHGFGPENTVLHCHNHALGKNASMPGALAALAHGGYRLLLQVHDFAEDFRPANYRHMLRSMRLESPEELSAMLYPQSPGIHYATLNSRDSGLLSHAGVASQRLHVLWNPIVEFADLSDYDKVARSTRKKLQLPANSQLIVYPVRGIRRKNLGEMLLCATVSDEECWHALTLAPENPIERTSYDRWESLSDALGLRCLFDIGGNGDVPYTDALGACDALITTSVAEGFGMVFLEAWLAARPLIGRNLPEITRDFVADGLNLEALRPGLKIPLDWIDIHSVVTERTELHRWTCQDYGVDPAPDGSGQMEQAMAQGAIDFALLPTTHQAKVIRRASEGMHAARKQLINLNPGLEEHLSLASLNPAAPILENAEWVRRVLSPEAFGPRLMQAYRDLLESESGPVAPLPRGIDILRHFLHISRLYPVRLEA